MEDKTNLLIISDDLSLYDFLSNSFLKFTYHIFFLGTQEDILSFIKGNYIKTVILDSKGTEEEDFELFKLLKAFDPMLDVIIIGEPVTSDKVMDWINMGAADYLAKPVQMNTLEQSVNKINEKKSLRRETYLLEKKLEKRYIFQGMIGKSPYMLEVFSLIENIAKYFSTALITGETGTGKEMIAKAIHNLSPVRNKRFVICDSSSIPDNLFESELFGYVRGAFTGADRDKKGLFEEAHEGMIFLDEIGEIPLTIQAKLLRVLETHQIRPLGSNKNKNIDTKVIASTNRNLREEVKKGAFREDLFHRLNKVEIHLPTLKKRTEDIPLLVRYFLNKFNKKFRKDIKGMSRQVQKLFLSYEWPGNVRELENVVESALMLCKREFIDLIDLPKNLQDYTSSKTETLFIKEMNLSTLQNLEKEYISYLMRKNKNNKRKVAEILDISRTTLYHKLSKYNISH